MDTSQGFYFDNFDSTQGVNGSFQVDVNTSLRQVLLSAGQTTGWLQSTNLAPVSRQAWQSLELEIAVPAGTTLTVDILDRQGNFLQSATTSGTSRHIETYDLSGISADGLALRARWSGVGALSPVLHSWRVRWIVKPNVFLKLTAATDVDAQGGTVVAGTQISYTIAYGINNVDAHNVMISTTLSAQDAYGAEMIGFKASSPSPYSVSGRYYAWELGDLTAGTNGSITFQVSVPNGTTCSWNSSGHSGGRPVGLTAILRSTETGAAGVASSPTGNSQVGFGGLPTSTFVKSSALDSVKITYPRYAIPSREFTYFYRIANVTRECATPSNSAQDEVMHNVRLTHTLPSGAVYVRSGLYNNTLTENAPFTTSYLGDGKVAWEFGRLGLRPGCDCTFGKGPYVYVTIDISGLTPGSTFSIPSATLISDQTNSRTAAAVTVEVVLEATVDANPNNYVQFSLDNWNSNVQFCENVYPIRNIVNRVNKPFQGAYILEPVPAGVTLDHWDRYCYPSTINGAIVPQGNTVPSYLCTTVTAADLPEPPNSVPGIWKDLATAKNTGQRINFILINLGNINYSLDTPNHDGNYRTYHVVNSDVPYNTTISWVSYFYAGASTPSINRLASNTMSSVVTPLTSQWMSFYGITYDDTNDPVEAGETTQVYYDVRGAAVNAFMYTVFPPELEYEPSGTTTKFNLRKNNCEGDHACPIEYTTTPGVYPFDRTTAERAAWSRIQPLDTSKITAVRWVLGDWEYYWSGGNNVRAYLSLRARMGVPNNTVATVPTYFVYDGLGSAPAPGGTLTTTILSHVELSFVKILDKSLLPTSRVRYYLTVANVGNMDETSAELWDRIPEYTEFNDTQAPDGSTILYSSNPAAELPTDPADWSGNSFGANTTWVKWLVPGVPAGEMRAVTLTVKPKADTPLGVEIGNTGWIASAHATTLTSNTVSIINAPDFSDVSTTNLEVEPTGEVRAGTVLRYTLKYYNTGLTEAHHVVLEDVLESRFDAATLQFIAGQVGAVEQGIFIKSVIAQQRFTACEHFGHVAALLVVAAEQKEHLGLERVAAAVLVEIGKEGVFFKHFQKEIGFKGRLQQTRQAGFPYSDDSFDGNVHLPSVKNDELFLTFNELNLNYNYIILAKREKCQTSIAFKSSVDWAKILKTGLPGMVQHTRYFLLQWTASGKAVRGS